MKSRNSLKINNPISKRELLDRLTPDGTWSGNLYDFYRLAIQRLFRDLKVPFRLEGDEREDDTPVHKALCEALVNAIIHADYAASAAIVVIKAPDYFSFRNPGKMRIPVSEALEGGHSDCRNRNLQRMFSLIGLGEQAGSGIPRMLENWKSQHYRLPELSESDEPETTQMRLRTVSLLPEATIDDLRALFGTVFDALDENSRLAVATAQIEGFVTNARLQHITRLHPRDITALLKALVDGGMLDSDGKGRGTTYRITETEGVDLGSSAHLSGSSAHLRGSSAHLPAAADDPSADPSLREIAKPVSSTGKTGAGTMRQTILALCRERYLSVQQLAALLKRAPDRLRERFIKPMVEERLLERRYPQQPNHERQAYRTRESSYE